MNNEEEIEGIKLNIFDLGTICKDTITHKKECVKNEKSLKEEIRRLFSKLPEEIRKEKLKNAIVEIGIRYSNSFDQGLFKTEYPELAKIYITQQKEVITTITEVFDKTRFKKEHPEEYAKCEIALTPSVTIK